MRWTLALATLLPTLAGVILLDDAGPAPSGPPGSTRPPGGAPPVSDSRRAAVVRAALGEVGESDAAKYWDSAAPGVVVPHGTDWCGGFVLWALHQAGLARGIVWNFGKGFELQNLPQTNDPQPGDVAYFDKFQHRAIVERVDGEQVSLVNGNGEHGAVSRSTVSRSQARAFFSIAKLVAEADPLASVAGELEAELRVDDHDCPETLT